MARIVACPCGHQIRGADEAELFRAARQHVIEHHPGMQKSDAELLQIIRERGRDEVEAPAQRVRSSA